MKEYFDKDIQRIKLREECWDIKILDFILENYKKIPCFVDRGHPSKYVTREIARRVAKYLGVNDISNKEMVELCGIGQPMPILPCVAEYFGFEFDITKEIEQGWLSSGSILDDELENYIREYLWWSHQIIVN